MRAALLAALALALTGIAAGCGAAEDASVFGEGDVLLVRKEAKGVAIYAMAQDGGAARRVVEGDAPRWSPDGARFAYLIDETGHADGSRGTTLWVLEADDGRTRRVLDLGPEQGVDTFAWAPDGTRLAFSDGLGVSIAQLEDGTHTRLSVGGAASLATSLDWSPDGRELLTSDLSEIVAVDVQSRRTRTVSSQFLDGSPRWSPDGELIALVRTDLLGGVSSLLTIDADGRETELTSGFDDSDPSWSSDGKRIYFNRAPRRSDGADALDEALQRTEIYVIDVESRELQQLTDNAVYDRSPEPRPSDRSLPDPPEEVTGDVVVPDLVRREINLEDEQRRFEELGLELQAPDAARDDQSVLLVVEQTPEAGARVPAGTVVEVLALDVSDPFSGTEFSSDVWKAHPDCGEEANPRSRMYSDLVGRVLEKGMTRARVLALLGRPERSEADRKSVV